MLAYLYGKRVCSDVLDISLDRRSALCRIDRATLSSICRGRVSVRQIANNRCRLTTMNRANRASDSKSCSLNHQGPNSKNKRRKTELHVDSGRGKFLWGLMVQLPGLSSEAWPEDEVPKSGIAHKLMSDDTTVTKATRISPYLFFSILRRWSNPFGSVQSGEIGTRFPSFRNGTLWTVNSNTMSSASRKTSEETLTSLCNNYFLPVHGRRSKAEGWF